VEGNSAVEQIATVLTPTEVGCAGGGTDPPAGGIRERPPYRWKKRRLRAGEVRQLRQLQEENGRRKQLLAELTLEKTLSQDALWAALRLPIREIAQARVRHGYRENSGAGRNEERAGSRRIACIEA
jgi:putative transposase